MELNIRDEDIMLLMLHYEELLSLEDLFFELENRDNLCIIISSGC